MNTHEFVMEVLRGPKIYSSHTGGDRPYGGTTINDMELSGKFLNMMDDPRHQRIRQLVNKGFTLKIIGRIRDDLVARSHQILDSVAPAPGERRACDLVTHVAAELPLQAICMLLGVPNEGRRIPCEWVDITSETFTLEEMPDQPSEASVHMFMYGQRLIQERISRIRATTSSRWSSTVSFPTRFLLG